jgi:uncharacterized membrane protein YphA (DoxX/SURF4 family)
MKFYKHGNNYTGAQMAVLILLRLAIGWHFLYEGLAKLLTPNWSSISYLDSSRWILRGVFNWISANPGVLKIVDFLNIWGLILIGLGLFLGVFTRAAGMAGILLLLLYYLAHPPLMVTGFLMPTEGNYMLVDKVLIELFALTLLVLFPTGSPAAGIRQIFNWLKTKIKGVFPAARSEKTAVEKSYTQSTDYNRREIIKSIVTLPVLGAFVFAVLKKMGWESYERKNLSDMVDAVTGATTKTFNYSRLQDLKGTLPKGHIGSLELSRVILGGNLIGGWAHARDLIYVDKLVKSYHTKEKIFETFYLAEKCGINCFLTNPVLCQVISEYWKREIGTIQFISDCAYQGDVIAGIKISIDSGAHSCYIQGGIADNLVQEGKLDQIARALDLIKQNSLPAGIGAHALKTVIACVDYGLKPDYWMKTLHPVDYWSAEAAQEKDNIWCTNPEETITYMQNLPEPWIAFKILAAGAIHPNDGFRYAFKNGADFICVGMYDFQIVDDVNMALEALTESVRRNRRWIA